MDDDHREAGDQEVDVVRDVEAERRAHAPLVEHEDPEGGDHRAEGRRQGNPVREEHADEDPEECDHEMEERRGSERNENAGRHGGADDEHELRHQPVEARARHAERHEEICENRRELAARYVEKVRQAGRQAAGERRLQRVSDLPLTEGCVVGALALRRGRNHARIPRRSA